MGSTIGFESVEAKLLLVCLWTVRLFFSVNTMGKNTVSEKKESVEVSHIFLPFACFLTENKNFF